MHASVARRKSSFIIALLASAVPAEVAAGAVSDELADTVTVDTITVVAAGVSNMNAASAGDVGREQMMSEPLLRPAAYWKTFRASSSRSTRARARPINTSCEPSTWTTARIWRSKSTICR